MAFIDYLYTGALGLSERQAPSCVLNSTAELLHGCDSTDYNCLCDQTDLPTFSDWVLETTCDTCNGQQNVVVDPLVVLGTYCPAQSQNRAATYSCSNYTPLPTQTSTIAPSLVLPSSTASDTAVVTSSTLLAPLPVSTPSSTSSSIPELTVSPSTTTPTPTRSSATSISSSSESSSSITPILASISSSDSSALPSSSRAPQTSSSFSTSTTISTSPSSSLSTEAASASTTTEPSAALTAHSKSGLSIGAKAGIGIAAALVPILLFLLAFFCWRRRRKNRNQVWEAGGSEILPELYTENGTLAAFEAAALNGNGASNMNLVQEKSVAELDHGVREVLLDDPNGASEDIRRSRIGIAMSPEPDSYPGDRASRIGLARSPTPPIVPPPKNAQRYSVARKEVPSPTSRSGYNSPTATYNTYDGRESQMSGVLRGPVGDMYQYGNEAIESDEELARLEEEERRIDEAIRESEHLALMRREREAVRARIENVRKSGVGVRPDL